MCLLWGEGAEVFLLLMYDSQSINQSKNKQKTGVNARSSLKIHFKMECIFSA